ncbi:MAG: pseudouridine synthase [Phycisphaerales bacterium]|nr:pseudouridine synthase [Phycisphaerales bacterium]
MNAPHDYSDDARGPRLQKVLAEAGVGSRRACEELIESGVVRVNGRRVDTLPAWVNPETDRITVDGRRIAVAARHVYIMLFKPRGTVCTNADPEGRPRAIDLVKHPAKPRLYPVGRLDIDSSGLLLLTNDGELANRLTHPRYEMHKTYEVTVRGSMPDELIEKLESGVFLHNRRTGAGSRTADSNIVLLKRDRERTRVLVELTEGRNRQIRRTMLNLGYPVKKLRRVALGPLRLKGLAIGMWRELTPTELGALRAAAFATTKTATDGRPVRAKRRTAPKRTDERRSRPGVASGRGGSRPGTSSGRSARSGPASGRASGRASRSGPSTRSGSSNQRGGTRSNAKAGPRSPRRGRPR